MAKKPRFRRPTVFAKNLGFGVGCGYRNNTTIQAAKAVNVQHEGVACKHTTG